MAMTDQFVLRLRSRGSVRDDEIEQLQGLGPGKLLDRSPRMLQVEADRALLEHFVDQSDRDWALILDPGLEYRVPEERPRSKKPE